MALLLIAICVVAARGRRICGKKEVKCWIGLSSFQKLIALLKSVNT